MRAVRKDGEHVTLGTQFDVMSWLGRPIDDAGFADSVRAGVVNMMPNSGQSCNAPSRMLVPNSRMNEAITVAREVAA